jgi:hypothetical protein
MGLRAAAALAALAVDAAIVVSLTIGLAILLTGGTTFTWGEHTVRALRARNAFGALSLAVAARLALGFERPFLGVPRWALVGLPDRALAAATRVWRFLSALDEGRASRLLGLALLVSFAVKLWNAAYYYGFTYGDDVEIHQMTFSAIQGRDLGVWELRTAFFPMVFIYPIQRALAAAGVADLRVLVVAGRAVVALFSLANVWLVYRIGTAVLGSRPVGLLAAWFLMVSWVHVRAGSTELPRTVAATFLLVAFLLVATRRGAPAAAAAGGALGLGGALRVGELAFAVPLAVHLAAERRWRDLAVAALAAGAAALAVLGPGDLLFWPDTFHGLRHLADFTVVRGQSSRGYEGPWHYLVFAPTWWNVWLLGLSAWGARWVPWRYTGWAVLPVVLLSVLPHKEDRYVIPVVPFLAVLAAVGWWRWLERAVARRPGRVQVAAMATLALATLLEVEAFRFRRWTGGVDVARYLGSLPATRDLAMEGGRSVTGAVLFVPAGVQVTQIEPSRLAERAYFWAVMRRPEAQYVVLRSSSLRTHGYDRMLTDHGYREVPVPGLRDDDPPRVFLRHRSGDGSD